MSPNPQDDIARTELLMSAVRIALDDNAIGDPDRLLEWVAHPSLDMPATYRLFATLIEATGEVHGHRRALTVTPVGHSRRDEIKLRCEEAMQRASIAALVLLFGEPEVDPSLIDTEAAPAMAVA